MRKHAQYALCSALIKLYARGPEASGGVSVDFLIGYLRDANLWSEDLNAVAEKGECAPNDLTISLA